MAEKTGGTGKMKFDFITHAVCEVQIKGIWYRTTAQEFRSFDGKRQLTLPERQPAQGALHEFLKGSPLKMITTEYNGPVFMYGSNLEVERLNTETIVRDLNLKTVSKPVELNSSRA